MQLVWTLSDSDLNRWRELVRNNSTNQLVQQRQKMNVERHGIDLSRQSIWKVLVGCQVTTQQKTGPGSRVETFLKSGSAALCYASCQQSEDLQTLLKNEFSAFGLRRSVTIADNLANAFILLEQGEWIELERRLTELKNRTCIEKEREVSQYLQWHFKGLGPKQSRNLIQWLGVSRFEVPLDSRVLKKLREFGFSFVPKATALSDEAVYLLVQSGVQKLAAELDIYPCVLDACIFSSFD